MEKDKIYRGIDGLRTIAALGIIAVHVAKNVGYEFESFFYLNIICRMEAFVNLFFLISGFSMFCGYYGKIKYNKISLNDFYKKRFIKIWPFFSFLVISDLIYSWEGIDSLADAFADLTLVFALLPSPSISIVGVGWTLGVIFLFYLLFPFFVFMAWTKKRCIFSFIISFIYLLFYNHFFIVAQKNILCNFLLWSPYFLAGALLYLFVDKIKKLVENNKIVMSILVIFLLILWAKYGGEERGIFINNVINLNTSIILLCFAIGSKFKFLCNFITSFIAKYTFEIYLLHMTIFRIIFLLYRNYFKDIKSVSSYIFIFFIVTLFTILGSIVAKKIIDLIIFVIHNFFSLNVKKLEERK